MYFLGNNSLRTGVPLEHGFQLKPTKIWILQYDHFLYLTRPLLDIKIHPYVVKKIVVCDKLLQERIIMFRSASDVCNCLTTFSNIINSLLNRAAIGFAIKDDQRKLGDNGVASNYFGKNLVVKMLCLAPGVADAKLILANLKFKPHSIVFAQRQMQHLLWQ